MEKGRASGTSSAAYPTWIIRLRRDRLGLPDHSYSWTRNSIEGQGKPVLLAVCERKTQVGKNNGYFLSACAAENHLDAEREVFFRRHLDPLMQGRRRWIRFTPPFGSHGAAQSRSEQHPPLLPRAEENEMIHRSWESAAGCASCGRAWLK